MAEFGKIVIIGGLASYGAAQRNQLDLRRFVLFLAIAGFPTLLVFLQPDLGTALVYLSIVLVMAWLAGENPLRGVESEALEALPCCTCERPGAVAGA